MYSCPISVSDSFRLRSYPVSDSCRTLLRRAVVGLVLKLLFHLLASRSRFIHSPLHDTSPDPIVLLLRLPYLRLQALAGLSGFSSLDQQLHISDMVLDSFSSAHCPGLRAVPPRLNACFTAFLRLIAAHNVTVLPICFASLLSAAHRPDASGNSRLPAPSSDRAGYARPSVNPRMSRYSVVDRSPPAVQSSSTLLRIVGRTRLHLQAADPSPAAPALRQVRFLLKQLLSVHAALCLRRLPSLTIRRSPLIVRSSSLPRSPPAAAVSAAVVNTGLSILQRSGHHL